MSPSSSVDFLSHKDFPKEILKIESRHFPVTSASWSRVTQFFVSYCSRVEATKPFPVSDLPLFKSQIFKMGPRKKTTAFLIAVALLVTDFVAPVTSGITATHAGIQNTHREAVKNSLVMDRTPNRTRPENRRPIILSKLFLDVTLSR